MTTTPPSYRGRFAPSPTGPLHAGSLVVALASWLDAKAHAGLWLVRMEDIDAARCVAGADQTILQQLSLCGLSPDEPVQWQSKRHALYGRHAQQLLQNQQAYFCGCTRAEVALAQAARLRRGELVYPGTCRFGLKGKHPRALRVRTHTLHGHDIDIFWQDRWLGSQAQNITQSVGDFVLQRADGPWSYQLAVVLDDFGQANSSAKFTGLAQTQVFAHALGACW
jgi:glutamyl-Q tRNA(Asp) synthetase